jgi:hypothetical protein
MEAQHAAHLSHVSSRDGDPKAAATYHGYLAISASDHAMKSTGTAQCVHSCRHAHDSFRNASADSHSEESSLAAASAPEHSMRYAGDLAGEMMVQGWGAQERCMCVRCSMAMCIAVYIRAWGPPPLGCSAGSGITHWSGRTIAETKGRQIRG